MSIAVKDFSRLPAQTLGRVAGMLALGVALVLFAVLAQQLLPLSGSYSYRVAIFFIIVASAMLGLAHRALERQRFGAANWVTMSRAALSLLLFVVLAEVPSDGLAWFVVGVATLVLVLDGLDGWFARSFGQTTRFGARFDMETDAALILILAVLCWQFGKAGPWIIAAGLLRYLFVAAAWIWPSLGRPLPASRRRQTICIVQSIGLLVCISPLFPSPISDLVALITLLLLTGSFGVDVAWTLSERTVEHTA